MNPYNNVYSSGEFSQTGGAAARPCWYRQLNPAWPRVPAGRMSAEAVTERLPAAHVLPGKKRCNGLSGKYW